MELKMTVSVNLNIELDARVKNKLTELINKLENIIIKEIECITEFLYEVLIILN
jgi:hypothetical protein